MQNQNTLKVMTKKDIIENVARKTGVSNAVVQAVIDEAISTVTSTIENGEPIYIRGLFTLSTVKRAKKYARHIKKGKRLVIPEHYAPHAKFSEKLREKVRKLPIK